MADSIKNKTIKGLMWSFVDKFLFEIIQFVLGIILARLLLPSDYGILGILLVFISFSTLFIDGGMATALIQKTDRTEEDYNTAFFYNLFVSIAIYLLLFIFAPLIARFYDNSNIALLLRVLCINLIISPFSSIQITRLTIAVDFKMISIASVVSGILSGAIGIFLAWKGCGVWALVFQQISMNFVKTIILNVCSKWKPRWNVSFRSFKELFSFGYKLIVTNLIARVYDNMYPLIIGKQFPLQTLGYYTRAYNYTQLPVNVLKDVFMRVSFPVLSSLKEDNEQLRKWYRLYIEISSFVIFPVMFLLLVIAKPLIVVMLTEKWLPAVPFMQLFCLGMMFHHISSINLNLLFVKGRSDLALKLEIIKKSSAFAILLISLLGGIWGICIGQVVYSLLSTMLNSIYTKRLIDLSFVSQMKDFGKIWIIACISIFPPYILYFSRLDNYSLLILCTLVYAIVYFFINYIFKTKSSSYYIHLLSLVKCSRNKG